MPRPLDLVAQRDQYKAILSPLLSRKAGRLRVLVVGNYGNRNVGDEAILTCLLDMVEEITESTPDNPKVDFHVPVRSPDNLRFFHDRENLHPLGLGKPSSLLRQMLRSDVVLIGGGGMFSGYTGPLARLIPSFAICAKLLRKKVAYVGIGVYGTASALQRGLVCLSMLVSDIVCLRDQSSAKALEGLRRFKQVHLGADLALFLADEQCQPAQNLRDVGLDLAWDEFRIGLSLKPTKDERVNSLLIEAFARIINELHRTLNRRAKFVFFPFALTESAWENDWAFGTKLKARIDEEICFFLLNQGKPREVLSLVGQMHLVLGMRLHSQIFAHLAGVPLVGVSYEDKNRDFLESIEAPYFAVDDVIRYPEKIGQAIIDEIRRTAVSQKLDCPSTHLSAR